MPAFRQFPPRRCDSKNGFPKSPDPVVKIVSPLETISERFPDGKSIESLRDSKGRLALLLSDGQRREIARRVQIGGRMFVPPQLSPTILNALTFPSKCTRYGTTNKLFSSVLESFTNCGFPKSVGLPSTYFVFSSWFSESLPGAPCLSIVGPRPEAIVLLQLLACLVRHPLTLGEISRSELCSLPMNLQLTLLIEGKDISPSALRLLSISNSHGANIFWKREVINIFAAKAIYCGETKDGDLFDDASLDVNLSPFANSFPFLDSMSQREIANKFQAQLLAYRIKNFAKVRDSRFDLSRFASGLRILSRILGACIVDAPEIQADLASLLRNYQANVRSDRWIDLRCVAIESMLHHCHKGNGDRIHVGKISNTAETILTGRGEPAPLESRKLGLILRSLGLIPKRDRRGFAIHLTDGVRRHIHELGRDFQVAAFQEGMAMCSLCTEVFCTDHAANRSGSEFETGDETA